MKDFNDWLGDKLAIFLSTMGCFYLVFALVIVPLFFSHPNDLVGWVQYIIQSVFQGIALPILGYVARKSGDNQEKIIIETHDVVIEELTYVKEMITLIKEELEINKEELKLAKEEKSVMHALIEQLHEHHIGKQ